MHLIVDSFEFNAHKISSQIYPRKKIFPLKFSSFSDLLILRNEDAVFYIHDNNKEKEKIKYYFNEVVEIEGEYVVQRNRFKKKTNFFEVVDQKLFLLSNDYLLQSIDRTGTLPHRDVENDEVVLFPSEEEE